MNDSDETVEIVYVLILQVPDFQGTLCDPPTIIVDQVEGVFRNREDAETRGKKEISNAGGWGEPESYEIEAMELE